MFIKIIFRLIVIQLMVSSFAFAQSTFVKRYDKDLFYGSHIAAGPNGSFYFSITGNPSLTIGRIDGNGDIMWARQIGDSINYFCYSNDVVSTPNGNFIVLSEVLNIAGATHAVVMNFDSSGNLIYMKKASYGFLGDTLWPNNLIVDGNGITLTANFMGDDYTHILKIDSIGNCIKSLKSIGRNHNIFKRSNNSYILYDPFTGILSSYDSNLNYQFSKISGFNLLFGFQFRNIIEYSPDNFLILGGYFGSIGLFNSNLEYSSMRTYTLGQLYTIEFISGQQYQTDKFVLKAQVGDTGGGYDLLLETDLAGNVLKCKYIPTNFSEYTLFSPGKSVYQNGLFTFMMTENISPNRNVFKIVHDNLAFNQICNAVDTSLDVSYETPYVISNITYSVNQTNCQLINYVLPVVNCTINSGGCNSTSIGIDQIETDEQLIEVYPVPFSNETNIVLKEFKNGNLVIYDPLLRIIAEQNFSKSTTINTSLFAPSTYFYEVRTDDQLFRGKIIKY